jgi:hypothetical protein
LEEEEDKEEPFVFKKKQQMIGVLQVPLVVIVMYSFFQGHNKHKKQ